MGRTVGVIHTVGEVGNPPQAGTTTDLRVIANQSGARLGMLRVIAESQLQAGTDSLTGLLNRRAFENTYRRVRPESRLAALAMADLDHFKELNDTYGHDTGDRALRAFAETLRVCLRVEDLICRRGGEEFAIFFPGVTAATAVAALSRVQSELRVALRTGGLPDYTASFGVIDADSNENLDSMLTRADTALFAAKAGGRDRIAAHDQDGHEELQPAQALTDAVLRND